MFSNGVLLLGKLKKFFFVYLYSGCPVSPQADPSGVSRHILH